MRTQNGFSPWYLIFLAALLTCLALPNFSYAADTEATQSFRTNFNAMLDKYQEVFQRINNTRGLNLISQARKGMEAVTDEQLEQVFSKTGLPDLSEAVKAADTLATVTPKAEPTLAAPNMAAAPTMQAESVPFPEKQPILSDCDNIAHSSSFTFGALIAFQIARGILEAAQFGCEQMVVVLGEGANTAAICIPLAIAKDAAAIPFELADFCSGEEDSAVLQASYDRLEHIHNDLMDAQTAIINNNNTNMTTIVTNDNSNRDTIINNDNTNTSTIVTNDNSNRETIIANANSNTVNIMNNDNANKDLIIGELRALGCEIVRLLNTPEGQRASSILACTASPGFPYHWPTKP